MKTQFPIYSSKRYYFVKDGVIFNIGSSNPNDDPCAIELGGGIHDEKLPSLTVRYNDGVNENVITYYLSNLISDGDKQLSSEGSCIFKKTVHDVVEDSVFYIQWLHDECIRAIKDIISVYPSVSNDFLRVKIRQSLPAFMYVDYVDEGRSKKRYELLSSTEKSDINGIQINILDDSVINALRVETAQEDIYGLCVKRANDYGFSLSEPVGPSDIVVE